MLRIAKEKFKWNTKNTKEVIAEFEKSEQFNKRYFLAYRTQDEVVWIKLKNIKVAIRESIKVNFMQTKRFYSVIDNEEVSLIDYVTSKPQLHDEYGIMYDLVDDIIEYINSKNNLKEKKFDCCTDGDRNDKILFQKVIELLIKYRYENETDQGFYIYKNENTNQIDWIYGDMEYAENYYHWI